MFRVVDSTSDLPLTYCSMKCEKENLGGRSIKEIEEAPLTQLLHKQPETNPLAEVSFPIETGGDDDERERVPA